MPGVRPSSSRSFFTQPPTIVLYSERSVSWSRGGVDAVDKVPAPSVVAGHWSRGSVLQVSVGGLPLWLSFGNASAHVTSFRSLLSPNLPCVSGPDLAGPSNLDWAFLAPSSVFSAYHICVDVLRPPCAPRNATASVAGCGCRRAPSPAAPAQVLSGGGRATGKRNSV